MGSKAKKKSKRIAQVDRDNCVACGACIKACKFGAITVEQGIYAKVDEDKCVGCKKCAKICPASIITVVSREETDHVKN